MERLISLAGLILFLAIAWTLSEAKRGVSPRLVVWGVALQCLFALVILKTAPGHLVFEYARAVMMRVLEFSDYGSKFLFGSLVTDYTIGATVAFKVLPVIIFTSALMGVLTHLNIIQQVVKVMAFVMQKTMRASGAEALSSAMFVFMGIEATTGVKDYIRKMTRSELFTVMTGFLSTIAGSVMAVYVSFGASAGHLLAASVMSAPAAIVVSKLMVPELGRPETSSGGEKASLKGDEINVIEALSNGAYDGMRLAVTVAAMLIAFIAIIGMFNSVLGYAGTSFETLAGYIFTPVAFVMGVPLEDCSKVGELLGIKVVFTEFIAYQKMQAYITAGTMQPRSITIATYALCSFANLSSIAMLIGGIGTIVPERKKEVASLALRALLAGVLASLMTATVAGLLV